MGTVDTLLFRKAPASHDLLTKLEFYRRRYGLFHSLARFAATRARFLWPIIGPMVSGPYRRRWAASADVPKLLNLGGGSNIIAGALTVDVDPRADCYVDALRPLPFEDASIDLILLEEFIEHVSKEAGARLLRECRRVLKPGGSIRVATPDLDWLGTGIVGGTVDCDLMNSTFYGHGHRYIYSRAEMARTLAGAGFGAVRHSSYQDPESALGYLDSHARRFAHDPLLSQYIEAKRPAGAA